MKNNGLKLVLIGILVFGLIFGIVSITQNWGKRKDTVNTEAAVKKLNNMYSKLNVVKSTPKRDSDFNEEDGAEKIAVLPDISEYPFVVNPTTDNFLTIYASTEKVDWMIDVANKFNESGATSEGKPVSVGVRSIPSSLGVDFISSKKYTPDVFAPAGEIYGDMLTTGDVKANLVEKRTAGNITGIVMTKNKHDELTKKYNLLDSKAIVESVLNNGLVLGYTTPLSNEAGFNFILSVMSHFDRANPVSDTAVEGLRKFQDKVPIIAYDNDQLKASLTGGTLDAIVMNYQEYTNSSLKSSHEFVPVGMRQDNPLYAIGELTSIKEDIAANFVAFCKNADSQKSASDRGFNHLDEYADANSMNGATILQAQKIYSNEKNGSSGLTAIFVADVSGSMEGAPLLNLKASLNRAIGIIDSNANVGLVTFSDGVTIDVPIAKFDSIQKSYFSNAVKAMRASGSTALFDAIIVAQKLLMDEKANNPNTKVMLFVLSDGEPNRGYEFSDIKSMTRDLRIPIYTIGYNADIDVLQSLSDINEAATMNADSDNVIYRLESLFNSQI